MSVITSSLSAWASSAPVSNGTSTSVSTVGHAPVLDGTSTSVPALTPTPVSSGAPAVLSAVALAHLFVRTWSPLPTWTSTFHSIRT